MKSQRLNADRDVEAEAADRAEAERAQRYKDMTDEQPDSSRSARLTDQEEADLEPDLKHHD